MNQQALGWQIQKHLRAAAKPLQDAADAFLALWAKPDPLTTEVVQECGQAILVSLTSLNVALEELAKLTAELPDPTGEPE